MHRAEDLLLRRGVARCRAGRARWARSSSRGRAARAAATDGDLPAVLLGERDEPFAPLPLRGADDRPHHRRRDRSAHRRRSTPYAAPTASRTSSLRRAGTSMRVAATHAWPAVMATTIMAPVATRSTRVGQVDLRRLPSELERDALHRRCGLGEDLLSDRGRAGERDHVDRGIGREQLGARRPCSTTTLRTPLGQPAGVRRGAEDERRDRREWAGPQDDRVAGHERRDELLERHQDRRVVRRDRGDDTDRLVTEDAERDAVRRRARRAGRDWLSSCAIEK